VQFYYPTMTERTRDMCTFSQHYRIRQTATDIPAVCRILYLANLKGNSRWQKLLRAFAVRQRLPESQDINQPGLVGYNELGVFLKSGLGNL